MDNIAKTELSFDNIPDMAFLPAIKVRDIIKARPLNRDEKAQIKRGGPDILATPIIGEKFLMNRADVAKYYTYTNGKKVSVRGWKSDKEYVIVKPDNLNVVFMQVPLNHTVAVDGDVANKSKREYGDYIVCGLDANGQLDRNTVSLVSSAIFKKMCYVPPNEVISRHAGSGNRYFDANTREVIHSEFNPVNYDRGFATVPYAAKKPTRPSNNIQNTPVKQPTPVKSNPNVNMGIPGRYDNDEVTQASLSNKSIGSIAASQAQYTVIGQVLDDYGQRTGYVIQSVTGATKQITKEVLVKLCKNKKISNVEAVSNGGDNFYLRGNGIKLEDLPISYM